MWGGRPDGARSYGCEFALDYFQQTQKAVRQKGEDPLFKLNHDACGELFDESRCIYERYAFLLQLSDFKNVVHDTDRNMRLFRFVNQYGEHDNDRMNLERWWPYVLRIHATARAMLAIKSGAYDDARSILRKVTDKIRELPELDVQEFHAERERSLEALAEIEEALEKYREPTRRDKLEAELQTAVQRE